MKVGTSLIWSCVCHFRACGNPAGDTSSAAAHLVSLLSVLRLLVAILTVVSSSIASELISPIDTPKDAISQTFAYIGVDKKLQIIKEISDPVVTLLTMAESLTPFLSSTVIGRKAWKLDFEKLIFSAKGYELLQIEADYIQHSHLQSPTRDVWSIHLYGLPPRPVRPGSDIPVEQRNHMRTVIDANTGQILFSTNHPQPVEY